MHNMICVKDEITRHIKGINFCLEVGGGNQEYMVK